MFKNTYSLASQNAILSVFRLFPLFISNHSPQRIVFQQPSTQILSLRNQVSCSYTELENMWLVLYFEGRFFNEESVPVK